MTTLTAPPSTVTRNCPKCAHPTGPEAIECPACHVIIEKAVKAAVEAAPGQESDSVGWLGRLAAANRLSIKQQVERLEAWTGIETPNAYSVSDGAGTFLAYVIEEAGSVADFLVRNFLESLRPFTMRVETSDGEPVLMLEKPARLYFGEVAVLDVLGKRMGTVQRQFSIFNSRYKLVGAHSSETYEIHGPFFRPWTFKIRRHGRDCGLITKRWSGLRREVFTDADAFGIEFPEGIRPELKAVFLGAVFLIDFVHFENNAGR